MQKSLENTQEVWKANVLEVQLAKAAHQALKDGKDPMQAAQERLKEMGLNEDEQEADEPEANPDVRRYLLAVCRLGSGQFEHLSNADLLDVACLVKLAMHSAKEWAEIRKQA